MKNTHLLFNLVLGAALLFSGTCSVLNAKEKPNVPSQSAEFELADQFEKAHEFKFPRNKLTVLVVADRPGSDELEGWIKPIYARYQKRIDISGVADVGNVPERLQNFVRSSFQKKSDYPILLDWTGKVCDSFGYTAKKANLYLIDRDGRILLHFIGPASQQGHEKIIEIVDRLLQPAK